jgi:hypothetical protein
MDHTAIFIRGDTKINILKTGIRKFSGRGFFKINIQWRVKGWLVDPARMY